MNWQTSAACAGAPPALFFPPADAHISHAAKAMCAACPVRPECLQWALDNDERGYWGGTSEEQRRRLRRGERARVVAACRASNVGWANRGTDSPTLLADTLADALERMDALGYPPADRSVA